MWRLPLWTPNVSPTMSGVIVERRDQVRITCGRCPPERTRSTILRTPLSIQGPFFTERGITLFRISEFGLRISRLQSAFRNQQSAIYLTLRSLTIIFFVRLLWRVL